MRAPPKKNNQQHRDIVLEKSPYNTGVTTPASIPFAVDVDRRKIFKRIDNYHRVRGSVLFRVVVVK